MDNTDRRTAVFIDATANQDWQVIGVFNASHAPRAQVFWRNFSNDLNAVWLIDDLVRESVLFLPASA
jgi:hypothetical protein